MTPSPTLVFESYTLGRVSLAPGGVEANDNSDYPSISDDGRYVAFMSWASNLVTSDTNNSADIFLLDRNTAAIGRISVASDGTQGNCYSTSPRISANGRYVVYDSCSINLVAGDTNNSVDIFLYDRVTRQTELISRASDGSLGNSNSRWPSVSGDGRYVVYASDASNLVAGDTNGTMDIFLRDRVAGTTQRVSVASDGTQGDNASRWPVISADGQSIAFVSYADNFAAGDTNNSGDVFLHDRVSGETTRLSVSTAGLQGVGESNAPSISADGSRVVFVSNASLVPDDTRSWDIYVRDVPSGTTTRLSISTLGGNADGNSSKPQISSDGKYVVFASLAGNLVSGDTNGAEDVFLRDLESGSTIRLSELGSGIQGDAGSSSPAISAFGYVLVFQSSATNLVTGDINAKMDLFIK